MGILCLVLLASSCRQGGKVDKNIVATAYEENLYRDNLDGVVPAGSSHEDSLRAIRNFVDSWLHQKVVLHKAEKNLPDDKKDVERQLREYRNSLIVFAYESELIRQKLDTVISENEIGDFYHKNEKNFELKDNIIKVIYLKLNKKAPKISKAREWYRGETAKDRQQLQEYCRQYAINYFLDDSTWLQFDDLLKEIPIKTYDKEQFLQNNRNIEIEDSVNIYFVSIKGFMVKNSLSPLSFERNNIRSMIINQRKLKLIEEMEHAAFEEARKSGDAEMY